MSERETDGCCELGVKDSCITCEFSNCCNGKWSHTTHPGEKIEVQNS